MAEDDKSQVFAKDQRYAIIPRDSIRLIAESTGFDELSDQVLDALSEDVSYRLREVIQQSCEFMRNAKRLKLTDRDFNDALRFSDCQPLHGHSGVDTVTFHPVKDTDVFITDDREVDLINLSTTTSPIPKYEQPNIKARWLAVEGVESDVSLHPSQLLSNISTPRLSSTGSSSSKPVSEDLLLYYDHVTKAILGTDVELMKFALGNISSNSNITPILPYLINFVANGVRTVSHDTAQLLRLLKTVESLITNPHLHLDPVPYLSILTQTILFCQLDLQAASINSSNDHWTVRDYSARLLAFTVRRWSSSMNRLKQTTENALRDALRDRARPFSSHYGAIVGLMELGLTTVEEVLIPLISDYWRHLSLALTTVTRREDVMRCDAHNVRGALLMVSIFLIRNHINLLCAQPESAESEENVSDDVSRKSAKNDLFTSSADQQQRAAEPVSFSSTAANKNDVVPITSSFTSLYSFLHECLGDSLSCLLPIVRIPAEFYTQHRRAEQPVKLGDEFREEDAEQLLGQFLSSSSSRGRRGGRRGVGSERSSRSSDDLLSGEDADMTIKATVSDTSRGIKLTILKRPKTKPASPEASQPSGSAGLKSPSKPPAPLGSKRERPSQGGKSQLVDVFAWVPMRNRDIKFVFKFQGRIQLCMFSERQKAQNLARAFAAQQAAISPYRIHCARLPLYSKLRKSGEKCGRHRPLVLDIGTML